jgi:hypothetical protein
MNSYLQRTKDTILDYLGKAQRTEAKINEGRNIYLPDSMEQEEKRLRGELMKARKETEAKLDSIYREASAGAREWGTLDGAKLTADASLLQGQGVTPEQFDQLVTKYQDNYTMLDQLKKYGEKQNAEAVKKAHEAGNHDIMLAGPYKVHEIPGPDARMQEWDDMRKRATYFLNVADGTGFNSDFERGFATSTAQKQFDAWGEEAPKQQQTSEDIQETFRKAWGFVKE